MFLCKYLIRPNELKMTSNWIIEQVGHSIDELENKLKLNCKHSYKYTIIESFYGRTIIPTELTFGWKSLIPRKTNGIQDM